MKDCLLSTSRSCIGSHDVVALQDADADARKLVQDVMLSVARAVGRWKPDSARGRFRTWLFRIARNQLVDVLAKHKQQIKSTGGTGFFEKLDQTAGADPKHQLQLEHRRALFRWAAERVKRTIKETTWQAFWRTAVEDRDADVVAVELKLTTGALYIARSRVLARMRDEVQKWEDDDAMS